MRYFRNYVPRISFGGMINLTISNRVKIKTGVIHYGQAEKFGP